jgi:hypothetical protein
VKRLLTVSNLQELQVSLPSLQYQLLFAAVKSADSASERVPSHHMILLKANN